MMAAVDAGIISTKLPGPESSVLQYLRSAAGRQPNQ